MADEPHEVVKLLLARMESHPEEFRLKDPSYHDRWYNHMSAIHTHGSEVDNAALAAKVRDIRMGEVHEQVLEELCNGEDRRREEREEQEYERNLSKSLQHLKQQQLRVGTLSGDMNPLSYASGGGGGAGAGIVGSYDYDLDRYRNTPTGSITSAVKPKPSPYDKIMNALKIGE
jgi:hypothetical protein